MSKLSFKIAFIIFLFAGVATAALAFFLFFNSGKILEQYASEAQSSLSRSIMSSIESYIHGKRKNAEALSKLDSIKNILYGKGSEHGAQEAMENLSKTLSGALEVSVLDANKQFMASSNAQNLGLTDEKPEMLTAYNKLGNGKDVVNSDIFDSGEPAGFVFVVLAPIKNMESGVNDGFVKLVFSAEGIEDTILNSNPSFGTYLINSGGTVIAGGHANKGVEHPEEIGRNFIESPVVKFALENTSTFTKLPSIANKDRISFYGIAKETEHPMHDHNGWYLIVERDYEELYAPNRNAVSLMILIIALLVFGCAAGAVFFTQINIADPINSIIKAIKETLTTGKYTAPTNISNNEIGRLNISFASIFGDLYELRSTLESRIKEKTNELEKTIKETALQNENLEKTKRAMINILEDAKDLEGFITNEKNKAETIIATMGEGLVMINEEGKVVMTNKVAEDVFGLSRENMQGHHIKDIVQVTQKTAVLKPEDMPIALAMRTGKTVSATVTDEFFGKTATKEFPVAFVISPIKDSFTNKIVGAVSIFRDITDEKRLNDAKTNFISVASHQLRTPLTSMRWFSEMLLEGDAGKLAEEQVHFVQRIEDSATRMVNLVNLLLQIARMEAGRVMVEPTQVSLKDLSNEVAESLALTLKAKVQKIELTTEPKELPKMLLDKDIVWQVVQNLITNANRYGSPKSTIQINITKKDKDGEVVYSVRNEGIGVPHKQKERIFEKFFRADNAVKAVPEGSGLGLSLVKSVVNSWGGKVWFESEEGKGATFYFTIPPGGMKPKKGEVKLSI